MHLPKINFVKTRMLIAVMTLNFVHCITLYYGNLSSYMYSVFFLHLSHESENDLDPSWILGIYLACYVLGTLSLDAIRTMISLRLSLAFAILVYDMGLFLTYFTLTHSVWATTLTFSVMGGLATGVLESAVLLYVAGWFKDIAGLVTSLAFASAALGAAIINQIITAFINPNDIAADSMRGDISYFSQSFVVERTPRVFLIIAALSFSQHVTGFCLLKKPVDSNGGEVLCYQKNENPEREYSEQTRMVNPDQALYLPDTGAHPNSNKSQPSVSSPKVPMESKNSVQEDSLTKTTFREEVGDKSPLEVLRTEVFYYVCLVDLAEGIGNVVVANYYKIFGQLWVDDDFFFAIVGSTASFLAVAFQVGMGYLVDLLGIKKALVLNLAIVAILLNFWYFTVMINKWLYLIFTVLLLCLLVTQFVLIPVAVLKLFGTTYLASNLGLILTSSLIGYFISPPIMTALLSCLGWFWLYFVVATICFLPIIPIILRLPNLPR